MIDLLMIVCFLLSANALQLVSNSSIPKNLTEHCSDALLANVNCSPVVAAFRSGDYYPISTLDNTCTTACGDSLARWEAAIVSACSGQRWRGYSNADIPLDFIPGLLRYQFNLTCITDAGRFCNHVAAEAAYSSDALSLPVPDVMQLSANGTNTTARIDSCDLCLIKNLRFQAGSPYYNGPELAAASVYQSKTSSCRVSGYPLNPTTTFSFYHPPPSPTNTSTVCSGSTYTIQAGDDCHSISKSQGIATAWLLLDNGLSAYCSNFPKNGTLCLRIRCEVATVHTNDTCATIAKAYSITVTQVIFWNPAIDRGCYNIKSLNGYQICVSAPGKPYRAPNVTGLGPHTATTPALVPSDLAPGTCTRCGRYYCVSPDENCSGILVRFGISLADFLFLNPEVNRNCSNLQPGESYCVAAVGDINTYPGHRGSVATSAVASFTPFASLPDSNRTTNPHVVSRLPLASGTRADCNFYFTSDIFPTNISSWKSYCALAAKIYDVSLYSLGTWNHELDVSSSSCTFKKGFRYCGKLYTGTTPTQPRPSYPVRNGTLYLCAIHANADPGTTCDDLLETHRLTLDQFAEWNPEVGADCGNFQPRYAYCIHPGPHFDTTTPSSNESNTVVHSSLSSTGPSTLQTVLSSSRPSDSTHPASPTQTNEIASCNKWYTVETGDTCAAIAASQSIMLAQFLAWNPAVNDCATDLWVGYAYCVGTSS